MNSFILKKVSEYQKHFQIDKKDVEEIIAFFLGVAKSDLYFSTVSQFKSVEVLEDHLAKKAHDVPLEYIFGYKDFYSNRLKITQDVLIPRHETEILVDKVISRLKATKAQVVFDVCCGSGAIGLAIKKALPHLEVYLSDQSEEALKIAEYNSERLKLDVHLLLGDLLDPYENIKADAVICNPPYISEEEYQKLELSVKEMEPKVALVPGKTGLEVYERLSSALPRFLNQGAFIAFEIGYNQKNDLKEIFSKKTYHKLTFEKDFSGHNRFFFLENE